MRYLLPLLLTLLACSPDRPRDLPFNCQDHSRMYCDTKTARVWICTVPDWEEFSNGSSTGCVPGDCPWRTDDKHPWLTCQMGSDSQPWTGPADAGTAAQP